MRSVRVVPTARTTRHASRRLGSARHGSFAGVVACTTTTCNSTPRAPRRGGNPPILTPTRTRPRRGRRWDWDGRGHGRAPAGGGRGPPPIGHPPFLTPPTATPSRTNATPPPPPPRARHVLLTSRARSRTRRQRKWSRTRCTLVVVSSRSRRRGGKRLGWVLPWTQLFPGPPGRPLPLHGGWRPIHHAMPGEMRARQRFRHAPPWNRMPLPRRPKRHAPNHAHYSYSTPPHPRLQTAENHPRINNSSWLARLNATRKTALTSPLSHMNILTTSS